MVQYLPDGCEALDLIYDLQKNGKGVKIKKNPEVDFQIPFYVAIFLTKSSCKLRKATC